jgi:hypothetical protein
MCGYSWTNVDFVWGWVSFKASCNGVRVFEIFLGGAWRVGWGWAAGEFQRQVSVNERNKDFVWGWGQSLEGNVLTVRTLFWAGRFRIKLVVGSVWRNSDECELFQGKVYQWGRRGGVLEWTWRENKWVESWSDEPTMLNSFGVTEISNAAQQQNELSKQRAHT